jgi:hypothetical protein
MELLDTREAAKFLRLSPATLEKRRTNGGGPGFRKLGRLVCYTLDDLETWVDAGLRSSTSDTGPRAVA